MAGKPVLHVVEAANNPVADAGAGITTPPCDPVQLDRALREFSSMSTPQRAEMGARGKKYAVEKLDWSILGPRYVALCERLLNDKID